LVAALAALDGNDLAHDALGVRESYSCTKHTAPHTCEGLLSSELISVNLYVEQMRALPLETGACAPRRASILHAAWLYGGEERQPRAKRPLCAWTYHAATFCFLFLAVFGVDALERGVVCFLSFLSCFASPSLPGAS
jgi:hypothetical protein